MAQTPTPVSDNAWQQIVAAANKEGSVVFYYGISEKDGNAILAHKRGGAAIDYGYVGDVDTVNTPWLTSLLEQGQVLVFAPITHDGKGQLLNTNADTIAQEIARGLSGTFKTTLVYSFEKSGVLMDAEDEKSVIGKIDASYYQELKQRQVIPH